MELVGPLWQIALALVMAGAVYGGIRRDLMALHQGVRAARKSARRAHKRIDAHIIESLGRAHAGGN